MASKTTTQERQGGFAAMDEERRRELGARGGRRVHELGLAYRFTKDAAAAAGRKGGATVSADSAHMAEIGRKGGEARARRQAERAAAAAGGAP